MVWFVLFVSLTSNSPTTHKFISKKERDYIIANTDSKKGSLTIQSKQKNQPTPWRQIFRFCAHFGGRTVGALY